MASPPPTCPISGDTMDPVFRATLLDKHEVEYFLCNGCGLLQTETPYWLAEAYGTAIARTDLGLVQRNVGIFGKAAPLIHRLHGCDAVVLDAAGGYGMLARLLRDRGFDAYTHDEHCKNLLCGPFEPQPNLQVDVLCAIEVMEHLVDPRAFLADLIDRHQPETILFSTLTWEGDEPPPRDWWYYAPETGQHITFFQPRTIRALAGELGLHYTRLRADLHLLTRSPLGWLDRQVLGRGFLAKAWARRARKQMRGRSRLPADYARACALVTDSRGARP